MSDLIRALERVVSDLSSASHRWALVGGLAVGVRSEPRTTRDVAVAVSGDAEAERIVRDLVAHGYGLLGAVEQTDTGRLATMRLEPPGVGPVGAIVDLLFATTGIEEAICRAAEPLEVIEGVVAPVAVVGHLIAMKVLSRDDDRRPQDVIDLRALSAVANDDDVALARRAVHDIEQRGFARGRDLGVALEDVIARFRGG